jgi:hypothetical protein
MSGGFRAVTAWVRGFAYVRRTSIDVLPSVGVAQRDATLRTSQRLTRNASGAGTETRPTSDSGAESDLTVGKDVSTERQRTALL